MYVWIRLKQEVRKRFLIFLMLGFGFSLLLSFFKERGKELTQVTIQIEDRDESELSKKFIFALKERNHLLFNERADLVFEVKEGFAEKFLRGELKNLIRIKRGKNHPFLDIIKDEVSSEVVNQFIYHDIFKRLGSTKKLEFEMYEESLKRTEKENEILSLLVITKDGEEVRGEESLSPFQLYEKYLIYLFFTVLGIFFITLSFEEMARDEERGMRARLNLSGIKGREILGGIFLNTHLILLSFFLAFSISYEKLAVKPLLLSFFMLEISFWLFFFIVQSLKKEVFIRYFSPVITVILVGLGLGIQFFGF